jgi:hypothetical protein
MGVYRRKSAAKTDFLVTQNSAAKIDSLAIQKYLVVKTDSLQTPDFCSKN